MSKYQIEQQTIGPDDPGFFAALARAHGGHIRPLCLCRSPGVEMYVAKVGQQYIVKRMTEQGRSFIKGLRYNLPANKPIAAAVLSVTDSNPTALYLVNSGDEAQAVQLDELFANSTLDAWRWEIGDVMPALPASTTTQSVINKGL